MDGATIHGGIDMTFDIKGGSLQVSNSTIDGGIDMQGGSLLVCGATINGGINAGGGTVVVGAVEQPEDDHPLSGECPGNRINGQLTMFTVFSVEFDSNTINGGLGLFNNGPVEVEGNDIQGPLDCSLNTSVTNDSGKPNSVTGSQTDECAGL